jgi:hypothetical protein
MMGGRPCWRIRGDFPHRRFQRRNACRRKAQRPHTSAPCGPYLRKPEIAKLLEDAVRLFHGERYDLHAWWAWFSTRKHGRGAVCDFEPVWSVEALKERDGAESQSQQRCKADGVRNLKRHSDSDVAAAGLRHSRAPTGRPAVPASDQPTFRLITPRD